MIYSTKAPWWTLKLTQYGTYAQQNTINQRLVFLNVFSSTSPHPRLCSTYHGSLWFAELLLCGVGTKEWCSRKKFLKTNAVPRRTSACVLERHHGGWLKDFFYSSSASLFHPSSSSLCGSVSLFLPPIFSSPPTNLRSPEGGLSTLWLVLLAAVQLWRMPAWLSMSCLIKMDRHITLGKAVLFSISLKRQHLMRMGNIFQCQRDSCYSSLNRAKACRQATCF